MSKKKIAGLITAAVLAIGVIGGSLAWFTSTDSVENKFKTLANNPAVPTPKDGVVTYENFDPNKASQALPGTKVNKQVQAQNTASYDQFIRVKITPKFTKTPGITSPAVADVNLIQLEYGTNGANLATSVADKNKWIKDGDYYYYLGAVGSGGFTNELLSSVTLSKAAGNQYKGAEYSVTVDVEAVQASNDAVADEFKGAAQGTIDALKAMQGNTAPAAQQITGAVAQP